MIDDQEPSTLTTKLLSPGTIITSRYELIKHVGTGGMASVYLAKDFEQNNKLITLKVLHEEFTEEKTHVERFLREVRLLNQIHHPNVVETFDVSAEDGLIFFTMEYLEGQSIDDIIKERLLTLEEIVDYLIQICRGLEAIHKNDIVHRDLKPDNVLLTNDGTLKIIDLGVARPKTSRLTAENQKVGSIFFIAPELWLGEEPTPAADIYCLGIILYEMLTSKMPFDGAYPGELMQAHLSGKFKNPIKINPSIPVWLNQLTIDLLAKKPEDRPRSATEIIKLIKEKQPEISKEKFRSLGPNISDIQARRKLNKTYVFKLTATRIIEDSKEKPFGLRERPKKTVIIPLPKKAAMVFEIEKPSMDFIFFGLFLMSLQVADGVLTKMGIERFGISAEGNPLLRKYMYLVGPENALLSMKILAISAVLILTVLAKRAKWIKNIIGMLSALYVVAAIIPWVYILFLKYN